MYSFWSIYRELLLTKDSEKHTDLKVCLIKPDSKHAQTRASLDTRITVETNNITVYAATIKQIMAELKCCKYFDFCPPSSIWVIDDVAYLTPYFYATRGGQGVCFKFRKGSAIYERIKNSVEDLITDLA